MVTGCRSTLPSIEIVPPSALNSFRIFSFIIWPLNILGNATLVYALRRTAQTSTISFKFIIIMSISDIICGITGLLLVVHLFWRHLLESCYLEIGTQWVLNTQGSFSAMMIALIALDRYLHMSYLTRYNSIMNTRRGYFIAFNSLFFTSLMAALHQLLLHYHTAPALILQLVSAFFGVFTLTIVLLLYYKAFRNLQLKATAQTNQVARSILNEARKFSKIATQIVVSAVLLTMPRMVALVFDFINSYTRIIDQVSLDTFAWFAILIHSANAFTRSVIFIMNNRLVKQLVKGMVTRNRAVSNNANTE